MRLGALCLHATDLCSCQVAGVDSKWSGKPTADKLAVCMTEVYSSVQVALPPTLHPHYLLTPRHLSFWVLGLQRYNLQGSSLLQVCSSMAAFNPFDILCILPAQHVHGKLACFAACNMCVTLHQWGGSTSAARCASSHAVNRQARLAQHVT